MRTSYFTKLNRPQKWYLIDAEGQILGRLCVQIAKLLLGKHDPHYTLGQDTGDFVVVINADKFAVSRDKMNSKLYYRHSGYPGGLYRRTLKEKLEVKPTNVIRDSVEGMLPHNRLGRSLITKLKVYTESEHPHTAQQPIILTAEELYKF